MIKEKAKQIWLKLLKAEANHRTNKIKKHEKRLIEIEMELKNGS